MFNKKFFEASEVPSSNELSGCGGIVNSSSLILPLEQQRPLDSPLNFNA